MADANKIEVRYYRFRNRLREKTAGLSGETPEINAEALQQAEEALADMSEDYPDWVLKDIDELVALERHCVDVPEERKETFAKISIKAHDMKGQGGTFGYPLITAFAESLYGFSDNKGDMNDADVELMKAHIDAMRAVIKGRIKGDGGEIGEQMSAGLDAAIRKRTAFKKPK